MITLLYAPSDCITAEIVAKAFIRSFSKTQVELCIFDVGLKKKFKPGVFVLLNPQNVSLKSFPKKSKIIILGKIDTQLADELNIELSDTPFHFLPESLITYSTINDFYFPIESRPLIRFDFPNEWNNLGFGGIKTDDSIWAVAQNAVSQHAVATIEKRNTYISLHDFDDKACVWINRQVGLIDTANWHFIEYFVSAHRFSDLISLPYLLDIPVGVEAAVTMRLDCDEDILSAKDLYNAYSEKNIPFSLAVKTSLLRTPAVDTFLLNIYENGGAILSHSVNHKVAWGDNYKEALFEAILSKVALEKVTEELVPFAVSPFHSNKNYSVRALEDALYDGFVGGIIANDPEYLMARGGVVPFAEKIISHSQQCMLHGDCLLHEAEDSLRVYKEAFDIAVKSNTFFGYLDHPFSPRYQYGWKTETQRIDAHMALIHYMQSNSDVLFVNENDCLGFMVDKSNTTLSSDQHKIQMKRSRDKKSTLCVGYSINGQVFG